MLISLLRIGRPIFEWMRWLSKWGCSAALGIGYEERLMRSFTLIVLITENVVLVLE